MNSRYLIIGTCAASLALLINPAFGKPVTQAQRDACDRAAFNVRPALSAREREGWIANCLADATVGSPPKKRRDY
jgi:hypothetical protein